MSERDPIDGPIDQRLVALLDTIVPPRAGIPGAGELGLGVGVVEDARSTGHLDDLHTVLAALPEEFETVDAAGREAALRDLEVVDPQRVASVVNMAYTAYYTHPRVLAGVSERTGYNTGPPQPSGYALAPFDEALLDPVRERPFSWRSDEG